MVFVFNGRKRALRIKEDLEERLPKNGKKPVLEIVLIGSDPINEGYLRELQKWATELGPAAKHPRGGRLERSKSHDSSGVELFVKRFSNQADLEKAASFIKKENENKKIDGLLILVSPNSTLFKKREEIINLVSLKKDIDFLRARLNTCEVAPPEAGTPRRWIGIPSVCQAVLIAIQEASEALSFNSQKVKVLIIGNQGFWGRRIQKTLTDQKFKNIFGVDQETNDLALVTREADILISCVGKPRVIRKEMVKKGAAVIDIGGDVDFSKVKRVAGFITPVPGGIGPLATILVFENFFNK